MLSPYTVTIYTKQDNPYNVIPDAPIEIRERLSNGTSGSLSIIYSDQEGLIPITQTGAKADSNGQFVFYAEAAQYNAVYESQTVPVDVGLTVDTLPSTMINNPSLPYVFNTVDAMTSSSNTFPNDKIVSTKGFYQVGDGGSANYMVKPIGTVSDGVDGYHLGSSYFEVNGSQLIFLPNNSQAYAGAFGLVADGINDDTNALNNFFDYCRYGSPIDGLPKGRITPVLPVRGRIKKTGTLNLIDFLVRVDFGVCEILQFDAVDCINWEGNLANLSSVIIRYDDSVNPTDIISNKVYGIKLSGEQPIAITSESVFSEMSQMWVFGAWRGFGLESESPYGGLFWQFIFRQLYAVNCYDFAFSFNSTTQVSTTTTIQNCHAGCKLASKVSKGSNIYIAKQHHTSSALSEPEIGADWNDFWVLDNLNSVNEGEWSSDNFYRTHGKGYNINNVQTVNLENCSMDGGNNLEAGSAIKTLNSVINIPSFHLEGHNILEPENAPIQIGSDGSVGWIYMFDLRVRLPLITDKAPIIGGVDGRNRNLAVEGVRNHVQNPSNTGEVYHFDGGSSKGWFNSVDLGVGVPLYNNVPQNSRAVRGTPKQLFGLVDVPVETNPTITMSNESNGAMFDANSSGVLTINLDDTVSVETKFMAMNRGVGSVTINPNGASVIIGPTSASSEKLIQGIKLTGTVWKTWVES
tara:strand:+ start:1062 stop:3128 length:2067 start_codon:yes stop_codon:yes gene_type:complete